MARLVGLVLLVLAIYLGVSLYANGMRGTFGRDAATDESATGSEPAAASADAPQPPPERAGRAAPSAITSRVRERVSGALAEGARRHAGE